MMAVLIIPFVKKTVLKWHDAQIARARMETFLIYNGGVFEIVFHASSCAF